MSGTRLERGAPATISARPTSSLLVERAADFLKTGPATSQQLVSSVCQLSSLPAHIAEHMAITLLREHPRFTRTGDGGWQIGEAAPRAWGTSYAEEPLLSELSFAVVDVETTGGRAENGDRITEIAVVTVQGGRILDVYETLVNPERPIPPFISQLTHISWPMVRNKAPFRDIAHDVVKALEGSIFVAHNAGFDWRFVNSEVRRATGRELTGRRLCTVRMARRFLPHLRSRSLDWVAGHYNVEIPPGQRHRAAGDAIATAHCLIGMLRDARTHGCDKWSQLETYIANTPRRGRRRGRRRLSGMPTPVDKDTTA